MHISFFNKKTRFVFQTMHISFCLDYKSTLAKANTKILSLSMSAKLEK